MTYEGLLEFLSALQVDNTLSAWELEKVEQIGADDEGEMRFSITLSLGPIQYRLTSYIPPASVMRDVQRHLDLHTKKGV